MRSPDNQEAVGSRQMSIRRSPPLEIIYQLDHRLIGKRRIREIERVNEPARGRGPVGALRTPPASLVDHSPFSSFYTRLKNENFNLSTNNNTNPYYIGYENFFLLTDSKIDPY